MRSIQLAPSARRLMTSLRDLGYEFPSALAELVDNSISAGAQHVEMTIEFAGRESWVRVADDGTGMRSGVLDEALRFGTERSYGEHDLGRYGLGLKTSSLSQGRRLRVATRVSPQRARVLGRLLDLDHVISSDEWTVFELPRRLMDERLLEPLRDGAGTVVLLDRLDRVLQYADPEGGWARRRIATLTERVRDHLGMVFHRFIEGTSVSGERVVLTVNGEKVTAWDPMASDEPATSALPVQVLELPTVGSTAIVTFRPYVLPTREQFSTPTEFERLSGPLKWNRQQGLYIYRADRLIQSGGWSGLRAADEHTKLARASLDFTPALDEQFHLNVAKTQVKLPQETRPALERAVAELCGEASRRYRHETDTDDPPPTELRLPGNPPASRPAELRSVGLALRAAAMRNGDLDALDRLETTLRHDNADIAAALGW